MKPAARRAAPSQGRPANQKTNRKTIHRWVMRKFQERADRINEQIEDLERMGSHQRLHMADCRLHKAISDKRKAEREMLAKTSLKDLIH